ncbi:aminoglycoside phosphotransferase [Streptomyces fagopyri]|uniref:aminoglycoside phosphotransferase n=1 Tax=Streptomyces fagopyri TaxID=2662397 RepID=UPI0036B885B2
MTAVMVELTRGPQIPARHDPDGVVLVDDVEALLTDALPGCGDDNPYNQNASRDCRRTAAPAPPVWRTPAMPTQRLTDLPDTVRRLIEQAAGAPVVDVGSISAGLNSAIAARVRTPERTLFVKGLPADHPRVWTQRREALISPHVQEVAPHLLWHVEDSGWSLLGFEYVEGGHADYTPTSQDLPAVMASMIRLAEIPAPALELKSMTHRFRSYVEEPADLSWFAGDSLLHTEWNPHNILIAEDQALIVDGGWASTGAAWIDPALWLVWLIAHGHTCDQAEQAAAAHPAWRHAPAEGLRALAHVQRRLWDSIADESEDDWATPMQEAARAWEKHRR